MRLRCMISSAQHKIATIAPQASHSASDLAAADRHRAPDHARQPGTPPTGIHLCRHHLSAHTRNAAPFRPLIHTRVHHPIEAAPQRHCARILTPHTLRLAASPLTPTQRGPQSPFFFACAAGPTSTPPTFAAKRSDESDSWCAVGLTLTNISVFAEPESAFWSMWVSFELR